MPMRTTHDQRHMVMTQVHNAMDYPELYRDREGDAYQALYDKIADEIERIAQWAYEKGSQDERELEELEKRLTP